VAVPVDSRLKLPFQLDLNIVSQISRRLADETI
jgi:hypothetical protein